MKRRRTATGLDSRSTRLKVWNLRLDAVAATLGQPIPPPATSRAALQRRIALVIDPCDPGQIWLTLAALSAVLPDDSMVSTLTQQTRSSGTPALLDALDTLTTRKDLTHRIRIVTDTVLVDVHHTAQHDIATGIQRVARQTAQRWHARHGCTLVAWTTDFRALRTLNDEETTRMLGEEARPIAIHSVDIVVPWHSTFLTPELAVEPARTARQQALVRHSENRTGAIIFDLVPIMVAETAYGDMPAAFASHLAVLGGEDHLAAISEATAVEYRGWWAGLGPTPKVIPQINVVPLAVEAGLPTAVDMTKARERFVVGDLPLVLCVGTHEPRKNHLAVLHAAEKLWREGVQFSLTFVSGRSWASDDVYRTITQMQANGRPVETASDIDDDLLWAAYRVAYCTVFPSFEEGYGLPVAESLAVGTPVVTSGYGSMREIASSGGAVFVDPRDDASVAEGLRNVLTSPSLYIRLRREARAYQPRTWDQYADQIWQLFAKE
ncbi:MAG: glycosyltransferase [Micrococcales bacterium]|nr:glycosyltransferase [Micrococcales bacterium]